MLHFDSIDDAICWIIEHQAARRNLDEEQQTIIWGRYYELRKKAEGRPSSKEILGKNYPVERTSQQVANELGVSEKTVRNAAAKTKKIDALGLTSAVMDGTAYISSGRVVWVSVWRTPSKGVGTDDDLVSV